MRFGELSAVEARIIAMYRKVKRKDVFLSVMESVVSVDERAVNDALQLMKRHQNTDNIQGKVIDFQSVQRKHEIHETGNT